MDTGMYKYTHALTSTSVKKHDFHLILAYTFINMHINIIHRSI